MKILILKTSVDKTIQKLFQELHDIDSEKKIDCLIQSSQIVRYQKEYPYINFIDICRERFENLPLEVINTISKEKYDYLYITLSGVNGYNYWNVMELARNVRFKKAFFYNCNGEKMEIPRKNIVEDVMCWLYIKWIKFIYR